METTTIKNLADFKRALTVGRELTMIHHHKFIGRDEKGVQIYGDDEPKKRIVKKALSTQVCFETETGKESWLSFPKASHIIIKENSITLLEEDYRVHEEKKPLIPILTYTL